MKNVDIYINGQRAVHDNRTAIGTIIRNFDFTDPGNRKQPYTNAMLLPVRNNQHIFEFASEPGYTGSIPYDKVDVEIFVDGTFLLKSGIGYLTGVQDGYYSLTVREQPDAIQTMKDTPLADLDGRTQITGVSTAWVPGLINSTSGPKLDFIFNEQQRLYSVSNPTYFRHYRFNSNFTFYVHSIFTEMASHSGLTFAGSLLSDSYFLGLRVICSQANAHNPTGGTTFFIDDVVFNSEKSFFDLFKAVLQIFGAVYTISGSTITLERYDDKTLTKRDWSGKLQKVNGKKFRIPNIAQNNYLRCKPKNEAEETLNEASWVCNNLNIENEKKIIEPDYSVYPFLNLNGLITGASSGAKSIFLPESEFDIVTDAFGTTVTSVKSLSDFVFVTDGVQYIPSGRFVQLEYTAQNNPTTQVLNYTLLSGDNRYLATYYNSQNDYASFEAMIADPVMYEAEIDLNVLDLHTFNALDLVIIPELAGEFYVNRLQYNFDKAGRSSRVDLIKYVEP
jgi:hypothetical protein